MSRAPWPYRPLLRAFPRDFRARFGADMADVFADRLRVARGRGRRAVCALWWRTALDTTRHGLAERRAARQARAAGVANTGSAPMWSSLRQDLQYGLRTWRQRPGVAIAAVATLALGIGATTSVFSVTDALLWRSLPYPAADRLIVVEESNARLGFSGNVAVANFDDWHERVAAIEAAAAWQTADVNLAGGRDADRVRGVVATPGLFELIGARTVVGRTLQPRDREPGQAPVAVLSDGAWRRLFGGGADIVGRAVVLDGVSHEIIGVVSGVPAFADVDVWRPIVREDKATWRTTHAYQVIARLAPQATLTGAASELDGVYAQLEAAHPKTNRDWRARLTPLQDVWTEDLAPTMRLSGAVVIVLLLLACANVANLLLARAAERRREFAVRRALGAARLRVLRQVLTEGLLLASGGALAGLAVAWAGMRALVATLSRDVTLWVTPSLDGRVLAFTLGATIGTALVFGVLPAIVMSRSDPQDAMRHGLTSTASPARRRLRTTLTFAQMTMASVLLIAAGLLVTSLGRVLDVNPGFDATDVVTFRVSPPPASYPDVEGVRRFYTTLLDRLRRLPQVDEAGAVSGLPLAGSSVQRGVIRPGDPVPEPGQARYILYSIATPGYFRALGMRLSSGRDFSADDTAGAPPVTIVNRSLADALWPGQNPIGREILVHTDETNPRQVVGVVDDIRQRRLERPVELQYFVPFTQAPVRSLSATLKLRAPLDVAAIGRVMASIDPALPAYQVRTIDDLLRGALSERRALTAGLGAFGIVALLLSAVGLSATVASMVAERRREIGIRLALGSSEGRVVRLFVRQGLGIAGAGAAAGVALSLWTEPLLQDLLFGVTALDLPSLGGAVAVLLSVALVTTWAAARRATTVDPLETLRTD